MPKPARAEPRLTVVEAVPEARGRETLMRVWDPFVRIFHWSLVSCFVIAYLSRHDSAAIHHLAGYAAGGLVVLRVAWGVLGTRYARFSSFVRHPRTVFSYLRDIATGREARHIGHNPAGGAMVLALMAAMLATATSGWMMTTDRYWGVEWVGTLHAYCAHAVVILVLLHLGGVAVASLRHRENLVRAMVTGRKRAPEADDID
ncbi:cytochrome b/b6 domain-containing protein [Acidimangrovimonas pyrenivorans]|uniref:Cytochrome b/b6 domain-containing protein n=1 Tax=Acidimangrovimonas pyrenivorans TaxID=2030798 RepID=A0ABV7AI83_9RHOB